MNYTERTKLIDGLSGVALMAILVEVFYGISDAAFTVFNYSITTTSNVIYILGAIVLIASLFMIITAFKKDKTSLAVYGTELLVLAITAGILPGTYIDYSFPFNKLNIVFPYAFGAYYFMKAIYLLSKRNTSNAVMLGVIEAIYISILSFGLLNIALPLFVIISVMTVGTLIYSITKKSKFILVHGLEMMIIGFSMLLLDSNSTIVFFGVMTAIYYLLKSIFISVNYGNTREKKSKRRKA